MNRRSPNRWILLVFALFPLGYCLLGVVAYVNNATLKSRIIQEGGKAYGDDGMFPFSEVQLIVFRDRCPAAEEMLKWHALPRLNKIVLDSLPLSKDQLEALSTFKQLSELELTDLDLMRNELELLEGALPSTLIIINHR